MSFVVQEKWLKSMLAWLACFALMACGSSGGTGIPSNPSLSDFSLVVTQPAPIQTGSTGILSLTVERSNGHTAAITLNLTANAQGITGSGGIAAGASGGTMTLITPDSLPPGTYPLDLDGTDGSLTHPATFDLSVVAPPVTTEQTAVALLVIHTASPLAIGSVGAAYSLSLAATGGTSPYTWNIVAGSLPPGLTLSAAGMLGGSPSGSGSFSFTAQVTDSAAATATKSFSLIINSAPLPDFSLAVTQPAPIQSGGTGILSVTVQRSNSHTAAITLNLAANAQGITGSGSIASGASGGTMTLTAPASVLVGTYPLDLNGTDGSLTHSATFNLSVVAPLVISTATPLAVGSVGAPYSLALMATGGTTPYTWTITAGSLPPGLFLSAAGILNGSPTNSGTFNFTTQVTDGAAATSNKSLNVPINDALLSALVINGSFEQNLTSWSQLGTGLGVQYTIVTDAIQGAKAVRVTNRLQLYHAPGQNVFSSTLANAGGTPVTTRFWVKLDAPGMARCLINLVSNVSGSPVTIKLILAEQVVRTANAWVEVSGTTTLAWSGTLTGASLEFNIGQPAELIYPGFTLDDIRIQRDADADGLPDSDEAAIDANNPDRDNDGLPDGWETGYALTGLLDPNFADADLDADSDGTSNHEEYWAATDPLDAASILGVPSVTGANAGVMAITKYLALLPSRSDNHVISGQHITGAPSLGGIPGEFASNVQALFDQTGKWPGILSMQYEGADATIGPLQVNLVNPVAVDWATAGGLVLIKFQPFDPWTLAMSSSSGAPHVDLVGLLNPAAGNPANLAANTAANTLWLDWLDQIATGLDQLQQAGMVVLWRPNSEMNNSSHWHSRQPRDAWIAVWRHMHDYFTNTRGLKNLIWVYEGDSVAHSTVPADYYYPGDDVVDLMGHNFYDDDWVLPYDLNAIFRRYPKIYGFPQAGSGSIRDGTWDNLTMIKGIRERHPRASLFATWNDYFTNGGSVFVVRSMVSQTNATALLNDPWVITREELNW